MAVMTITWVTRDDAKVCPVCRSLHGVTWAFHTDRDPFPSVLHAPGSGKAVWDCARDRSLAHGGTGLHCRCRLNIEFDVKDIQDAIHDKLTWAIQMTALPPASAVIP